MFQKFLCLKTKQNTEMSNEEHSDSEFYYPEEQETAERKASRRGWHFDKLKQADKVSSGCKKCHIINYLLTSTVRSLR